MQSLKQLGSPNLYTIHDTSTMLEACRKMKQINIRHLVILDVTGKLTGILSERDVQRAMHQLKVSEFDQIQSISPEAKVADYMTWPVCTIFSTSTVETAARQMLEHKISSLVVVSQDGSPEGIVTTDDILKCFLTDKSGFIPKKTLGRKIMSLVGKCD